MAEDEPLTETAATHSEDVAAQEHALGRRRRRPTGTPPALPKSIGGSGKAWLAAVVVVVVLGSVWLRFAPAFIDRIDSSILEWLAQFRTPWLTSLARWVNTISSNWGLALVGLTTVGARDRLPPVPASHRVPDRLARWWNSPCSSSRSRSNDRAPTA